MKVGFIGLGKMGSAMAANILKAGHDLTVYNRTRERAERLAEQGAKVASTVAEACRGQVVVFTMLAARRTMSKSGCRRIDDCRCRVF